MSHHLAGQAELSRRLLINQLREGSVCGSADSYWTQAACQARSGHWIYRGEQTRHSPNPAGTQRPVGGGGGRQEPSPRYNKRKSAPGALTECTGALRDGRGRPAWRRVGRGRGGSHLTAEGPARGPERGGGWGGRGGRRERDGAHRVPRTWTASAGSRASAAGEGVRQFRFFLKEKNTVAVREAPQMDRVPPRGGETGSSPWYSR